MLYTNLRRSKPAAKADPFIGANAFSLSLAKRKTEFVGDIIDSEISQYEIHNNE